MCAVARVVMQLFDKKWKLTLEDLGVKLCLMARYMDDVRVFLPPIRLGWRGEYRGGHVASGLRRKGN